MIILKKANMGRDNFTIKTTNVVLPGRSFASNLQKKHYLFYSFFIEFVNDHQTGTLVESD